MVDSQYVNADLFDKILFTEGLSRDERIKAMFAIKGNDVYYVCTNDNTRIDKNELLVWKAKAKVYSNRKVYRQYTKRTHLDAKTILDSFDRLFNKELKLVMPNER